MQCKTVGDKKTVKPLWKMVSTSCEAFSFLSVTESELRILPLFGEIYTGSFLQNPPHSAADSVFTFQLIICIHHTLTGSDRSTPKMTLKLESQSRLHLGWCVSLLISCLNLCQINRDVHDVSTLGVPHTRLSGNNYHKPSWKRAMGVFRNKMLTTKLR